MEPDILELLTDKNRETMVKEFSKYIQQFSKDPKNAGKLDYSFDISKGKIQSQDANTWISFDVKENSAIHQFLKALYFREINEEDNLVINIFIQSVANALTDDCSTILKDVIRKSIMPNSDNKAFPLNTVKICHIDLVDYSSIDDDDRHLLKIKKLPNVHINMQILTQTIAGIREKTGLSSEQIVDQERMKGNKDFDGVLEAEKGEKYLWDVGLALFVDYSVSDDLMMDIKNANKSEHKTTDN